MIVQGQRSRCQWNPLTVYYLTSIVSNNVSLTALKIFDVKVVWPRSRTVQGHPLKVKDDNAKRHLARVWLYIWLQLIPIWYLSPFLKYLTCNINNFDIEGHPRSKVTVPVDIPGSVSYSASIESIMVSVVTVFEIFNIKVVVPFHQMWKFKFVFVRRSSWRHVYQGRRRDVTGDDVIGDVRRRRVTMYSSRQPSTDLHTYDWLKTDLTLTYYWLNTDLHTYDWLNTNLILT